MKIRIIALAVLAALAAGGLWATGSKEAAAAPEERMTISWFGMNPQGTLLKKDSMVELYLEQKFNVNIEPWYDVDNYAPQQYKVKIAAGDIPDMSRVLMDMVELGVAREVPKDMIAKYMPVSNRKCLELAPDTLWNKSTFEGKNYGIPYAISIAKASPLLFIRKDWMQNVGVAKKPDSLDELEALFLKFRNEDPDRNGKKDTYAYIPWADFKVRLAEDSHFPNLLGAFGVTHNATGFTPMGDKVGRDTVTQPYRDALRYFNGWFKKEIIHPEFAVAQRKDSDTILAGGRAGAYEGWSSWAERPGLGPYNSMRATNANLEVEYVISPKGPTGKRGVYQRDSAWGTVTIGKQVNDKKLVKIMQMLEVMHTDEDVYSMINLGRKGEHWKLDEKGRVEFIGNSRDAAKQAELGVTYFIFQFIYPPIDKYYVEGWRFPSHEYALQNQTQLPILYAPSLSEEYRTIQADILMHEMQYFFKSISGASNLDADWDSYVAEWKRKGGDRLVAEASRLYAASLKK